MRESWEGKAKVWMKITERTTGRLPVRFCCRWRTSGWETMFVRLGFAAGGGGEKVIVNRNHPHQAGPDGSLLAGLGGCGSARVGGEVNEFDCQPGKGCHRMWLRCSSQADFWQWQPLGVRFEFRWAGGRRSRGDNISDVCTHTHTHSVGRWVDRRENPTDTTGADELV